MENPIDPSSFPEAVENHTCRLEKHWPFTDVKKLDVCPLYPPIYDLSELSGSGDLGAMSKAEVIASIYKELSWAALYVNVYHPRDRTGGQALEAFRMIMFLSQQDLNEMPLEWLRAIDTIVADSFENMC